MLWVIWFHGVTTTSFDLVPHESWPEPTPPWLSAWWPVAVPMSGDIGVDLFLVISGCEPSSNTARPSNQPGPTLLWRVLCRRQVPTARIVCARRSAGRHAHP
eukprot:3851335-Prymnesium_polylepis.1